MAKAMRNIAVPMTLACAGTPRIDEIQTNLGNVVMVPELKLVMMKSSNESENASKAAAAIPGRTNGKVTRRKVSYSLAYKSRAASSNLGSRLATRAFTVTTTKEMQNMMCAMTVVQKPVLIFKLTNIAKSEAPMTISGVAIGRKMSKFVELRPRNLYLPSAKAIIVPRIVARRVDRKPILSELPSATQISGAPHGFFQLSSVKPCQLIFRFPASLKENAIV